MLCIFVIDVECVADSVASNVIDCETDFIEVSFSFSNQVFHEEKFSDELKTFSDFINVCFGYTGDVAFVLCSYEMNGYLLGNLKSMLDINDDILARFPNHYVRQRNNERSLPIVNFAAQDIFTENPLK